MITLGITGPSGAGKSIVSERLAFHGIPVIDADAVYHALLQPPSPCLNAICGAFGNEILNADGTLDRPKLAGIVFHNEEKQKQLNGITHKFVIDTINETISQYVREGHSCVAVDAPLLIESGMADTCRFVIAVLAEKETRVTRIMQRDGISKERACERIAAQPTDAFYRDRADLVIDNNGDIDAVRQAVDGFIRGEFCHE